MTRRVRVAGLALTITLLITSRKPLIADTTPPTPSQVERLAGLAKLWGAIKFFHPYIAERDIDWDSALVQAIPKVESASSPEEYQRAIDYLLSFLHDPGTHIVTKPAAADSNPPKSTGPSQPYVRWTDDHIAIVVSNDFRQFAGGFSKVDDIKKTLGEASKGKGIVFDLRSHRRNVDESSAWQFPSQFIKSIPTILDSEVIESATRSRMFSGYPSEEGGSGEYFSAFVVQDGPTLQGTAAKGGSRPMAFLIDSGTPDMSALLGGLQAAGQAIVVLEGPPGDEAGFDTYTLPLPDGLKVDIRVDELTNPDGSVGLRPDVSVPRPSGSSADDAALDAALAAIRTGIRPKEHGTGQALAVPYRWDNPYPEMTFPSKEYRLLALFRFWNVMQYFHAYQDLLDQPWDRALTDFIPSFEADRNAQEYAITVAKMVARIQDSHGFVRSKALDDYIGTARPPVEVRLIEGQTVVTRVLGSPASKSPGVAVGDVILAVDGEEIAARRQRLGELFAVSTPQALHWIVNYALLAGASDKPAHLRIRSARGDVREVEVPRLKEPPKDEPKTPVFRVLPEGFGYIDLTRLMPPDLDHAFDAVRNTPALIFDMRGYPNGVFYLLGAHLTEKRVVAARFETPTPQSPDPDQDSRVKFVQYAEPDFPSPSWKYRGKVVVLIDERAISQAEHTCLFIEAMTHAKFVGTPTNGANGDVTSVVLPGDIRAHFTGHDVRHADGRQLQRLGIQPDIRAEPSIEGIRNGRDEVLEAAVNYLRTQK
jgi:C-terminal processing protease CtpA/Prc